MLLKLSSVLRSLSTAALCAAITACTQQPAPVALRGGEDFSRHTVASATALPELSPAAGGPATAQAAPAAAPVDMSTVATVSIPQIGVSDLPPPAPAPLVAPQQVAAAPKAAAPTSVQLKQPPSAYIWPVAGGKVIAKFGPAGKGRANDGITIAASQGEPVYASAGGEVAYVGDRLKGYGNMVIIKHKGSMHTTYAHLSRAAVSRYDHVKQGDIIGYVGSSGKVSQPQLYFAMQSGSTPVDPQRRLSSSYADSR